jgi:hypothetical protein
MKKRVLIDTSSAILLFKSGWMVPLMERYRVVAGPTVLQEMTVRSHPGAGPFGRWLRQQRILQRRPSRSALDWIRGRVRLDAGESECIALYRAGEGAFILVDDGPAASFCRRQAIPYVNALLIPRLLNPGRPGTAEDMAAALRSIYENGRYAPWVIAYAQNCPRDALSFFLP